ncbi:DUF4272 domain-containing protein [Limibacter armeniacum]|uniref:DUF4272 domain-containing protein n=1 Tax=Limibacter armeniacum TaxID=466084 RepID=UPI002FE60A66
MEHCTIYSHYLYFDKVIEIVKSSLPNAKVEVNDGDLHKSLVATISGGLFGKNKTLKINSRQRANPSYTINNIECELTQNLAGMANFVQSLPAKNEDIRNKFVYKILSANCEISFMAEPDMLPDFQEILSQITYQLDAFIFAQPSSTFNQSDVQYFADKELNLILDTEGNCNIEDLEVNVEAKYYDGPAENYSNEQLDRKNQTEAFLEENGIKINKNLPCTEAIDKVQIRTLEEVVDRTLALLIIAAKGEGVEQEHLSRIVTEKNIDSFSPIEKKLFDNENLDNQERTIASWRYESLYTMLWALNMMPELKYPSDICDVATIVGKVLKPSREEFESLTQLRSKEEILDELDRTYRMHWACVDARINGQNVGGNINPSVIYERHYSLNWLTNYMNEEWDDVQTHT